MKKTILALTAISATIIACDHMQTGNSSVQSLDKNPSMNNPNKFAWELFTEICKPYDTKEPDGATVWEKWALAPNVFDNPNEAPKWEKVRMMKRDFDRLKGEPLQQLALIDNPKKSQSPQNKGRFHLFFDDSEFDKNDSIANETRMNKTAFDFIVENNMYYAQGIEKFYYKNKKIDLPPDTKEIKAEWIIIPASEKDKYHYSVQKDSTGKSIYWGLVSLHIISKDIPNWTWATFENKYNKYLPEVQDNPILQSKDTFGIIDGKISDALLKLQKENGLSDVWQNYILRGTQTNFTSSNGETTILGNTYTERGFLNSSSCITCHSRATVGDSTLRGKKDMNRLSVFKVAIDTTINGKKEKIREGYVGTPNYNWFVDTVNHKTKFIQTDFMWSMAVRAQRQTNR